MTSTSSTGARRSPTNTGDQVSLSAAYPDSTSARAVVEDLERAGLRPTLIVPLGQSWDQTPPPPSSAPALLERPGPTAAIGAMTLGALTGLANLIRLDGRHWVLYVALGVFVGALTGWIASALTAAAHPAREEDIFAYPGGALTVEVEADRPDQARVAETVMSTGEPTVFKATTRPGRRPPEERVMWHHEAGLSPLEVVGAWFAEERKRPRSTRGRHLPPARSRP